MVTRKVAYGHKIGLHGAGKNPVMIEVMHRADNAVCLKSSQRLRFDRRCKKIGVIYYAQAGALLTFGKEKLQVRRLDKNGVEIDFSLRCYQFAR